jgi:acetyl esterase/lipase
MTPQDLDALPHRAPDRRIAYGNSRQQYGELRVPAGPGPHPLAIIIHGGCFKAAYATADYAAPIGDALKDQGIASWNIEYRRLGDPGGGWPGTYRDVGRAVDYLRTLAKPYNLDLSRVVVVGHSAGGHLAMWAAGRSRVPKQSAIYTANPLPIRGAVDLAGPLDLSAHIAEYEGLCRDSVITSLMGGTPATRPERYAQASPIKLLPYGLPSGAGARDPRGLRADAADACLRGRGAQGGRFSASRARSGRGDISRSRALDRTRGRP